MMKPDLPIDRLLVGASGSIGVVELPAYLANFRAALAKQVRVIMTASAAAMIPAHTVAFFCDRVFREHENSLQKQPGHIQLTQWADMFVVLPTSVNILAGAANGMAQNLLTTSILASPKPVVFCPNTNDLMWDKPATQRNLQTLRNDGHVVIDPDLVEAYDVDTGELGRGRTLPPPERLIPRLLDVYRRPEFS
jgi:phosphopantothenoylcysteine synthetase/decarboxylase